MESLGNKAPPADDVAGRRRWLRTMLTASLCGTGGWLSGVADVLARPASAGLASGLRPRRLLVVWLQGGPSQLETFDPHPGYRLGSQVGAIETSLPGIQLAETLPRLAERLHGTSMIRSMVSREGDHERATYHLKTGWRPEPTVVHPAIGSVICHQSPQQLDIPAHISILPGQWPARGGYLGSAYDAFRLEQPGAPISNLRPSVAADRLERRLQGLEFLEQRFAAQVPSGLQAARAGYQQSIGRAQQMMDSEQLAAFELEGEPEAVKQRFGADAIGRGGLAAVRLIEAGVSCVELELGGWDSHINNREIQLARSAEMDRVVAALLDTLAERELLDQTLVWVGGEFGRTPRINPAGGRDHWPTGFSTLLAGGGIRPGVVIGSTNPEPGDDPSQIERLVDQPVSVTDLHATLLTALGIDPSVELLTPIGRPLRLAEGRPLSNLLAQSAR
jgi:hypothetical protein